jgi:hypothetical protein
MAHINERGWIEFHPSSGDAYKAIRLLLSADRRRLGWLLWKNNGLLPGYFMIRDKAYKVLLDAHLTPMQVRLYERLMPLGSRHHESKIIQWLWDQESTAQSRSRLRRLASRVNDSLILADSEERIGRVEPGILMLNTQEELKDLQDARFWPRD